MTDSQTPAPEAGDEVVQTEAEQVTASEATESTKGQADSQPATEETAEEAQAKADAEAEEKRSKSAERRERRKAKEAELRDSEAAARKAAEEARAKLDAARKAMKSLPKPKQSDFQDFDEYTAALSAYQTAQIIDSREVQRLENEAKAHFDQVETVKRQKQQEAAENWQAQIVEGREKYADFDTVVLSDSLPISQQMADMIAVSDVAADVSYFLGKNPQMVRDIAGLDPVSMARAIGRLEAQVTAPKPKTATEAPEPIAPVRGKATAAKDPRKMSYDEYRAARAQGKI